MKSKAKPDASDAYEQERGAAYRDFYSKLKAVGKLTVARAIGPVPLRDMRHGAPASDSPPSPPSPFERLLFRLYEHIMSAEKRRLFAECLPASTIIRRLKQKAEAIFKEVYVANIEEFAQRAGFYAEKEFPEPYLGLVVVNARGHTSRLLRQLEDDILEGTTNRQLHSGEKIRDAASSPEDRIPDDQNDENEWVRIPRADWQHDAAYSQKPPPLLRPVAIARLAAIATLRRTAAEAVQSAKPQTPPELEQCLGPAFEEYANHLFDKLAEAKLKTAGPASRHSKAYATWLKSKCLPAVVADVCKPIFGQFPITLRYIAEMLPDVSWPEELARVRRTLWKVYADEVIPGAFTDRIKKRLSIPLLGQRVPHWEAQAMDMEARLSQPSKSKARKQRAVSAAGKGDTKLLKKADRTFYESVNFPTAENYADIRPRRRQQLVSEGILTVVGKGRHRRITVMSLMAYCPPVDKAQ